MKPVFYGSFVSFSFHSRSLRINHTRRTNVVFAFLVLLELLDVQVEPKQGRTVGNASANTSRVLTSG